MKRIIALGLMGLLVASSIGCCGVGRGLMCCPAGPNSICEPANGCECGMNLGARGCGPMACGVGCGPVDCAPCGPTGCETDCAPCGDPCGDPCCDTVCGPCFPLLRALGRLFRPNMWCGGGGCGEFYWSDFHSIPPECCDPCDPCGNFVRGPRGYTRGMSGYAAPAPGGCPCNNKAPHAAPSTAAPAPAPPVAGPQT